ncbi:uncharacterized protein LOC106368112 [Brassica napus]|uniref:uncharacterized protein LOC106314605 n=1 Tax=Brassica oleracea var. oleracea TaxID=109376 RepID=UPI0006A70590|nr:PREDICTED: uncharacterized protein LOC106314605 [Brassica oleracea var. oleracea]XP_013663457.2 uncharacterized protein LOC106368112 [Brassica napus]
MSGALDKALLEMSLEENDEPYVLPDRPEYYSTERNSMSLIGRLLNPQCQKMSDLILEMPRKWQLYDRVKGVALSKDRFQFIFKYERDLLDVLNRGPHTSNMWSIVLERWVEKPPVDYLQYLFVWVQMQNIPVNHYTPEAIHDLGKFAGEVVEVPFDPEKAQTKDYLRVKVKFDVSRPLRRAKKVTILGGEEVNILYDYERIQKRCYTCQRLTHEQSMCHIANAMKFKGNDGGAVVMSGKRKEVTPSLDVADPLFGLVPTNLLGTDHLTGRPKIVEEVLEGMRIYLKTTNGPEKMAREERVKNSLRDLEDDPIGHKAFLSLEPLPLVIDDLDKGKGIVFDFSAKEDIAPRGTKLMAGAIAAGNRVLQSGKIISQPAMMEGSAESLQTGSLQEGSTGYSIGFHETNAFGTSLKRTYKRRRPGTFTRKANGKGVAKVSSKPGKQIGEGVISETKRKASDDVEPSQSSARFKKPLVVPNERPSNI